MLIFLYFLESFLDQLLIFLYFLESILDQPVKFLYFLESFFDQPLILLYFQESLVDQPLIFLYFQKILVDQPLIFPNFLESFLISFWYSCIFKKAFLISLLYSCISRKLSLSTSDIHFFLDSFHNQLGPDSGDRWTQQPADSSGHPLCQVRSYCKSKDYSGLVRIEYKREVFQIKISPGYLPQHFYILCGFCRSLVFKGSVSQDFRPPVFSLIRTHLGPW